MMTKKANEQQQYWYIQIPTNKFPKPKFNLGQQVRETWTDPNGMTHHNIGEIIGMLYGAVGYHPDEWHYLIRILKSETSPFLIGSDDRCFLNESCLVADDTKI